MTTARDPRTPCIIGVARRTWHPADAPDGAPEPLAMWEEMARAAAADAGVPGAVEQLDGIDIVYSQSWQYDDAPARLAARLGASPARRAYSGIGGTVPQTLAVGAADHIWRGDLDLTLIVGAEALATVRRLKMAGAEPQWSHPPAEPRPFPMNLDFLPSEISHDVHEAYLTFALFENARRAHLRRELEVHRTQLGRVLTRMTEVAAASPHAWFPIARSVEEIITPTADNRMVSYPYTKFMVAIMDVDMAAGLVLASAAKADALGVAEDKRVYLRGWGYGEDPEHVAEHPDLWRSPAMAAAAGSALGSARIGIDEIAYVDFYSCFPSPVGFALDTLGLAVDDPRGVTRTGGLAYHGGPGSDYVTHSLAAMVETLRTDPGSVGLVSALGMHMQKHSYALWSTEPGPRPSAVPAPPPLRTPVVDTPPPGPATVATYAVLHGRDGAPTSGLLVCDLPGSARCYARLDGGVDALAEAEATELIGRTVTLTPKDGLNLARID
jgi:acetyl-CoA C-acetyltransferase